MTILPAARPTAVMVVAPTKKGKMDPIKIPIKTLPKLTDIIDGKVELNEIRNLSLEDLLARPPVGLDPAPVKQLIRGRRVMVTGARSCAGRSSS